MKKLILSLILVPLLATMSCTQRKTVEADYAVVPLPASIVSDSGRGFTLDSSTRIAVPAGDSALAGNAALLAEYLHELTGIRPDICGDTAATGTILLSSTLVSDNPEAYRLQATPDRIIIDGASPAGNFYGIQTLRKSIPEAGDISVYFPAVTISDKPRFGYRGAHLDVARHFFPADSVKKFIDIAALHNINTFHWHLTDDQGWRVEIKKYPRLAEVASVRKGTCIGKDFDSSDSIPYGGYYTQDEIRDVVRYAAERHINVIPEIDLPGHMVAALTAYPSLGCTGGPYDVWQRWGISDDVLCAGNDSVYIFIRDVLDEITELFPSEYIHVGGDECPKVRWENCPACQTKIKELKLATDSHSTAEQKLQSHAMQKASEFLAAKGRRMIGWDEIMEGGLTPGTVIMSWRGPSGGLAAAQMGHDAVMTPNNFFYFDYYQSLDQDNEPLAIGGYLPLEKTYSFVPVPDSFTPEEAAHIKGVQANLWTEYIADFPHAQYMELPRMAALSEVQWCEEDKKDFNDFRRRLMRLTGHYDALGYNYARHLFDIDANVESDSVRHELTVTLSTPDNAPVRYTLDGSEPHAGSTLYEGPVVLTESATIKARTFRPGGHDSRVFTEEISVP